MHARLEGNGKATMDNLLDELARRLHQNKPQLRAVLQEFMDVVADELAQGKHVQVGGLGGLRMTLSCPPGITDPDDVRGGSISVKSLQFTPEPDLIKHLKANTVFRRNRYKKNLNDDLDLVLGVVREYFADPDNKGKAISSKILAARLGLTKERASERLRELVTMGVLVNPSVDPHHPMYLPGEKL